MTLLSDTRYIFIRYLTKTCSNPYPAFLFPLPTHVIPRTIHTAANEAFQFSRNITNRSKLSRVCGCGNCDAKRVWKRTAVRKLDSG